MSKEVFVNDGFQDQFYQGEKAKSSATAQLRDEFMNACHNQERLQSEAAGFGQAVDDADAPVPDLAT